MKTSAAFLITAITAISSTSASPCSPCPNSTNLNPIVDIEYAIHQGSLNTTGGYYSYSNIRYAEPPIGELRFAKPIPPQTVNRIVNNGSVERTCPPAYPLWLLNQFAPASGVPVEVLKTILYSAPAGEDCLFLDVFVPQKVQQALNCGSKKKFPVLIWIHGGGFVFGSKSGSGPPTGLIQKSVEVGDGMIIVGINYRLGMFGWLAGNPDGSTDIVQNAGLYDQRLALDWVQNHISKFGGDCSKVTVMGESAGGSSIEHHITAYGGEVPTHELFNQAIPQSPGFSITFDVESQWNNTIMATTAVVGVSVDESSSIDTIRQLSEADARAINIAIIEASAYGNFGFGPTVDGDFVPETPAVLLNDGKFDENIKILAGHNLNESATFVPPIATNEQFLAAFPSLLYNISQENADFITTELYPNDMSGAYGYTTQFGRAALIASEVGFTCNTRYLALAGQGDSYSYLFAVPPGFHAEDIPYTFYDGSQEGVVAELADKHQEYISRFVMTGNPNCRTVACDLETFPKYGNDSMIISLGVNGNSSVIEVVKDGLDNPRCDYWQTGDWRS